MGGGGPSLVNPLVETKNRLQLRLGRRKGWTGQVEAEARGY